MTATQKRRITRDVRYLLARAVRIGRLTVCPYRDFRGRDGRLNQAEVSRWSEAFGRAVNAGWLTEEVRGSVEWRYRLTEEGRAQIARQGERQEAKS